MPYRISPEGVVEPSQYLLPDEVAEEIRNIRKIAKLPPDKKEKLLKDIQKAIQWTHAFQEMPLPGRDELSKTIIKTAKLSAQLTEALRDLPPQAMHFFNDAGVVLAKQAELAERIMIDCGRAADIAKKALGGPGETPKGDIQMRLCYDIAIALKTAGVEVTVARPKAVNNKGGPFRQISNICFTEAKIAIADMQKHMTAGREMLKSSNKINR